jgi:hypothetical protein
MPGIPDFAATKLVQPFDRRLGNGKLCAGFMDQPKRVSITSHFLFVAIFQSGLPED